MDTVGVIDHGIMCLSFCLLSMVMPVGLPSARMPTSFSKYDFIFSKYLKCVQEVAAQTLRDVVRTIYSRRVMRARNGTMSIRHYNMRANVDPEYYGMEEYLDCNIMEENFDISFAYEILKQEHICGKVFLKLSSGCKELIRDVVSERNRLCHIYGEVFNFEEDANALKGKLKDIYKGFAKVLRVSFDENIQTMEDNVNDIAMARIRDDSHEDLGVDLQNFKNSKRFRLLESGRKELHEYYKSLKTISPLTWIDENKESGRFNMAVFTPPKLHDNLVDLPVQNLLKLKMKGNVIPDAILIQGLAGSGKTSLCRYIIHNWCSRSDGIKLIKNFDLVLLIEIRKITSTTILEYLREELLRSTCSNFEPRDILSLLQELNVLFVIDGYDEKSEDSDAVVKILFEEFHDKRIILTTRPELLEDTKKICKKHNMQFLSITLAGFDNSRQEEYSKKVFSVMKKNHRGFLEYLDGRGRRVLHEHLMLPLTVALLIVLWMDRPETVNKITNATSLYYELFILCQKKLGERLITQLKARGADNLKTILPRLLRYLGKQAWFMLLSGYGCILIPEIKAKIECQCRDKNIDDFEFLSAFLMCEVNPAKTKDGNDFHEYSFLHKTQMEYLAAEYLANSMKFHNTTLQEIACEVRKREDGWKRYQEVLLYLIGNMAKLDILENKEKEIVDLAGEAGIDSTDYSYWWKMLSESKVDANIPNSSDRPIKYKSLVHPQLGKIIDRRYLSQQEDWILGISDVSAGLRLMCLVNPVQLAANRLVIKIPSDVDPSNLPDFVDAMNEVYEHWSRKTSEKKEKVKVEIHLRRHSNQGTQNTSERFLIGLDVWADLENFTGGFSRSVNLSGFRNLKTIRCLVTQPDVCNSFSRLPRSVRSLRITLALSPAEWSPGDFIDLNFSQDLELTLHNIKDEYMDWITTTVHKIARRGLKCLHLRESEVSYEGVGQIVESLNGILVHALYVTAPSIRIDDKEHTLHKKARFRIEWLEN